MVFAVGRVAVAAFGVAANFAVANIEADSAEKIAAASESCFEVQNYLAGENSKDDLYYWGTENLDSES